jgi:quercetin dioxygenase-like cupin family protein
MKFFIFSLLLVTSLAQAAEKFVTRTMNDKDLKWGPCPEIFPKGCEIGVLHGTPDKIGADVYLRVPGNYVIPPHTHTSAEHMTLVSGNLEVKYKGEDSVNLKQGSYAFGPAKLAHQAKCTSEESCVLFISFDEPIDAKAYNGTL